MQTNSSTVVGVNVSLFTSTMVQSYPSLDNFRLQFQLMIHTILSVNMLVIPIRCWHNEWLQWDLFGDCLCATYSCLICNNEKGTSENCDLIWQKHHRLYTKRQILQCLNIEIISDHLSFIVYAHPFNLGLWRRHSSQLMYTYPFNHANYNRNIS